MTIELVSLSAVGWTLRTPTGCDGDDRSVEVTVGCEDDSTHANAHSPVRIIISYRECPFRFSVDFVSRLFFGACAFGWNDQQAREQALRGNRDIYVIGAANVGKSTFINYIIDDRRGREGRNMENIEK